MKKLKLAAMSAFVMMLVGCGDLTPSNVHSADPTERGLSYVALAIVSAAIIRAIFG